jgi:hypothetical protein
MPKVKWGGAEVATASDIDNAEMGFTPYAGDIPPNGVYRFRIERAKQEIFGSGNHGLKVLLTLDGSWKPAHAKYDGCPVWTNVVNTKAAAAFVRAFCEAIGVTSAHFLNATVVDTDKVVTSIGPVKVAGQGLIVYANCKRGKYEEDGPWRLEGVGTTFIKAPAGADEESAPDGPQDGDVEDAPAEGKKKKGKKGGKDKAGKKGAESAAAAEDKDPPF